MIKAVIDTNILVSGLISPKASPAKIISLWQERKFVLVISEEIIEESKRVLLYPKIFQKYGLSERTIDKYLKIIKAFAEVVKPKENDKFLEAERKKFVLQISTLQPRLNCEAIYYVAALGANVNFIVSGDKHLLELKEFRGIRIIKAEKFLRLI